MRRLRAQTESAGVGRGVSLTAMRNLRHPITTFVVGILAVIGVGVALVSGLPNAPAQRAYGSAPLRFEAAFPGAVGQPVVRVPDYGLVFTLACSNTDLISIDGVDMSAVSRTMSR